MDGLAVARDTSLRARAGQAVVGAVDKGVHSRWEPAKERAANAAGDSHRDRVKQVRRLFAQELGTAGLLSGGIAAAPGVGTATAVGTAIVELGWVTVRFTDLILTIAALHGHGQASVEERRAWVMTILVFGNSATQGFTKLASEVGKGVGKKATSRISTPALAAINRALGRTIVTKYGTKRGAIALGRVLPFGVGAAIGGAANYLMVRTIARQADSFFEKLPYASEVRPVEETGSEATQVG